MDKTELSNIIMVLENIHNNFDNLSQDQKKQLCVIQHIITTFKETPILFECYMNNVVNNSECIDAMMNEYYNKLVTMDDKWYYVEQI